MKVNISKKPVAELLREAISTGGVSVIDHSTGVRWMVLPFDQKYWEKRESESIRPK